MRNAGLSAGVSCETRVIHQPEAAYFLGRITVSITWITPLLDVMSVLTTFAPSTMTVPSLTVMARFDPSTVFASLRFTTSLAFTLPGTT